MKNLIAALLILNTFSSFALENGEELSPELMNALSIDKNKITIIDFFASWCVSCRVELPQISKLIPNLDNQQIDMIGINVDEELDEGQAYIDTFKPTGGLNFRVYMDPEQQMIDIFEPLGMPALYYIQNGIVKKMHLGAMANIDKVIKADLIALGYK
jgi:thiol-disulfide isomerase/thioredoxin